MVFKIKTKFYISEFIFNSCDSKTVVGNPCLQK